MVDKDYTPKHTVKKEEDLNRRPTRAVKHVSLFDESVRLYLRF